MNKITIAVFGGSISSNEFGSLIAQDIWKEKCNNIEVFNYGIGGAGFVVGGVNSIPNQVKKALSLRKHDIYILWCSTNDYNNLIPYGELNNIVDNIDMIKSQTDGINYCINLIRKVDTNSKIILFTSLRFFSTSSSLIKNLFDSGYNPNSMYGGFNNKNLRYYVKKQIECCLFNNVPYLDLNNICDFNENNYKFYFKNDKLHLTKLGYEIVGNIQASFLIDFLK